MGRREAGNGLTSCPILQIPLCLNGRNSTEIGSPCVPVGPQLQLTCAGHSREHPALPIFHLLAAVILPASQDVHTADPSHGTDTVSIIVVPAAQKHTLVIIAVDL